MRLGVNEAVELTFGELLNTPSISYFNSIVLSLDKVQKGSLFVAKDNSLIPKALELGAYGILYTGECELSDRDVAWIKVKDVERSLEYLFKFWLLHERLIGVLLSPIELEIAQKIIVSKTAWCLRKGIEDLFALEGCKVALFCESAWLDLFYRQEKIGILRKEISLLNQSLFYSPINYKQQHYELKIPCIFLEPLMKVIDLCERLEIEFDLNHLCKKDPIIDYCKPFYVGTNLELAPYGTTARVIVAESSQEYFKAILKEALKTLLWGKVVVFYHKSSEIFFENANNYFYTTQNNLKEQLRNLSFNFAFVYGVNSQTLESFLNPPLLKKTPTLF
ncbi:ferrochelatase [Helicobacter cetorum]|uniref:ferrochelatase n=1 Tax=Helicobacter cetorum TaxID=138563 RepID=UPI000CF170D0|nr:ferrochelatase [Helicobacter cetorum]